MLLKVLPRSPHRVNLQKRRRSRVSNQGRSLPHRGAWVPSSPYRWTISRGNSSRTALGLLHSKRLNQIVQRNVQQLILLQENQGTRSVITIKSTWRMLPLLRSSIMGWKTTKILFPLLQRNKEAKKTVVLPYRLAAARTSAPRLLCQTRRTKITLMHPHHHWRPWKASSLLMTLITH